VRGAESVQIGRSGQGVIVISVRGPGVSRAAYGFDDEPSCQEFLTRLEKRLLSSRWVFHGEDAERRSGVDRRAGPRTSLDRRRRW
jgi:hypothetical protein